MARCELTGKGPVVVNLVSHSNIKTKSRSLPNVQKKRLYSAALDELVTLKVAVSTIRDLEHCGGFDKFILGQTVQGLSPRAQEVRNRILRKLRGKTATAAATTKKAARTAAASAAKTVAKTAKPAAKSAAKTKKSK
jgi:large subunit ribosomal protein L28